MNTQPNDIEKTTILEQILQSPDFKDSRKHQDLLKFLVSRPPNAETIKETEIALAVFGKDIKFDPSTDSLVRSYISTLRKKLDHYYLTTTDTYSFKLEIPKGHYIIQFTRPAAKQSEKRFNMPRATVWTASWVVLFVLVIVLSYREFTHRSSFGPETQAGAANQLWNEFLQPNGRPTLIVFGDFFFMRERLNPQGYYRSIMINSIEDYLAYIDKNPEFGKQYMKANFTYLRPSAPWGLMKVLPVLQQGQNAISLNMASEISPDVFKTSNIIFIGSFKTLYLIKKIARSLRFEFDLEKASFSIRDKDTDSAHVFRPEMLNGGALVKDYGVVVKGRGPEGSTLLLLSGFSESGVIQAAHAAADPKLFTAIAERYHTDARINPASMILIFSAEGITQSLFSTNIRYVTGLGEPPSDSTSAKTESEKTR